MSEENKIEKFPNLHSKTIGTITAVVSLLTYIFCESGIIPHA